MYITYDLVEEIVGMHEFDCVFELDAPRKIFNRLMAAEFYSLPVPHARAAEFKQCWELSEIYCPHEGIDRRREYGIETVG